jgi:hypothetical protein
MGEESAEVWKPHFQLPRPSLPLRPTRPEAWPLRSASGLLIPGLITYWVPSSWLFLLASSSCTDTISAHVPLDSCLWDTAQALPHPPRQSFKCLLHSSGSDSGSCAIRTACPGPGVELSLCILLF